MRRSIIDLYRPGRDRLRESSERSAGEDLQACFGCCHGVARYLIEQELNDLFDHVPCHLRQ